LIYVGCETSFGGWIFIYSTEKYHVSPVEGAYMTSLYWGAFTFGRFLSVAISAKVKPHIILFGANILGAICILILLLFQSYLSVPLLWIMSTLYGIFLSPIYACTFAFPTNIGVNIDSFASSFFVIGGSIGDMSVPAIVGVVIALISPSALMVVLMIMECMLIILCFSLIYGVQWWCPVEEVVIKPTIEMNEPSQEEPVLNT